MILSNHLFQSIQMQNIEYIIFIFPIFIKIDFINFLFLTNCDLYPDTAAILLVLLFLMIQFEYQ